jgi:hypothetical protein
LSARAFNSVWVECPLIWIKGGRRSTAELAGPLRLIGVLLANPGYMDGIENPTKSVVHRGSPQLEIGAMQKPRT